jgi:two-component system, cell cycle response regulator
MVTLLDEEEQLSTRSIARLEPHARERAVLIQMSGLEAGRVCSVDATEVTLGRSSDCVHCFDEASLSRLHAKVIRTVAGVVIRDEGSRNGVFVNERKVVAEQLRDGDRVRLGSAITLRFQLVDDAEEKALRKVYESSVKDGLTGAFNRKHLEERLASEVAFAVRHRTALSVILLDIDFFKKVNDTYGHLVGDDVLRATADVLRSTIRTEDLLARYGGEEFVVLVRGTELGKSVQLAERLRATIEARPVEADGHTIARTISAGVASLECCGEDRSVKALLGLADDRLYRAKESGRNRVVAS